MPGIWNTKNSYLKAGDDDPMKLVDCPATPAVHIFLWLKLTQHYEIPFYRDHMSSPLVKSQNVEALLSFKAAIIEDPHNILSSWNTSKSFCMWPGIICSMDDTCISIISLNLSGLNLLGTISPEIGMLERLRVLSLSSNRLSGPIPSSLSLLCNLEFLDLSNNNLSGKIPEFFATFPNLHSVNFSKNDFFGEIPSEGHFGYLNCSSFFGNPHLYSAVLGNCNGGKKAKGNKGCMRWQESLAIFGFGGTLAFTPGGIAFKIIWKPTFIFHFKSSHQDRKEAQNIDVGADMEAQDSSIETSTVDDNETPEQPPQAIHVEGIDIATRFGLGIGF
ncbi:hypothetical protein Cgig2_007847 [Carnegiea gigantea]|uniref:Leucine-rich repeat-containing N-terminal plant-type domain-containing protein n=1 Tax=Carnegiea gigantea TaxID=171969 RepID=A0A9Q1GWL9_9CARY|nr:hypothetical protein Cgig2_007847 [Carnegiea gigantea]